MKEGISPDPRLFEGSVLVAQSYRNSKIYVGGGVLKVAKNFLACVTRKHGPAHLSSSEYVTFSSHCHHKTLRYICNKLASLSSALHFFSLIL